MPRGRLIARRAVALVGAIVLVAGSLAVPAAAGAVSGDHSGTGFSLSRRAPIDVGSTTTARAVRLTREQSRPARASHAAARPDRFAGTTVTPWVRDVSHASRLVAPADLLSTRGFDGIDMALAGNPEPPDPWLAVNRSYIVQSTNGLVRITDRNGVEKAAVATWAMFNVWPSYADADPRIIWDEYHQRWLGSLLWYDSPTFQDHYLSVIVSQSSDPLGAWATYTFPYGSYQPDYPAIASSTDKIVVTANEYVDGVDYAGSSFLLLPWSSILSGAAFDATYSIAPDAWNLRPGRILGTTPDLHLIYESGPTGNLRYLRLRGSAGSPGIDDIGLPISNGAEVTIAPRQPGDTDGIARADDGRIADAVWWNNQLWFTRTIAYAWNGTDADMAVQYYRLATSHSADPVVVIDGALVGGATGVDEFSSGIGISAGGTAFITYSQSSSLQAPSLLAVAVHPTLGVTGSIVLATSGGSYDGDRWGDFAGVAADPLGTDAVWQTHEVADADGGWMTVVSRLVLDLTAPTGVTGPRQALIAGSTLGTASSSGSGPGASIPTVPVKVTWTGADTGSGINRFVLDVADHGSGFGSALRTTATSSIRYHTWRAPSATWNSDYQYAVVAYDDAQNASGWVAGPALTPLVYQQTSGFRYAGSWRTLKGRSYSGGSTRYSTRAGASATFKTTGRSFGFVTTKASSRGRVRIYVDGKLRGTFRLTSAATRYRNIAYAITYSSTGTHSIKLVVVSGRVDVDAFVVLR